MDTESVRDYPIGFAALTRHLRDTDLPVATHGADLCATAVLFAIDALHPRTMAALANTIIAQSGEALSPALCEVAASRDPDRDPDIRSAFGAFLSTRDLLLSDDEGWAVLARVGVRHARELAQQMVSGSLDPIEGALEIERCFDQYLSEEERRRICVPNEPPPLERSRSFQPFVGFSQVAEDLYQAGRNLNEWNDQLPYAPSNQWSPIEKEAALARLRERYVVLATECLRATRNQ